MNEAGGIFDAHRLLRNGWLRRVELHAELPSTNDRAIELAADAELRTPALVVGERQTSGRGRGANRWWSSDGALTCSLILEPQADELPVERWSQVSLAAAVAICSAVDEFAVDIGPNLKWPNDVYMNGRKLSGILVEVPSAPRGQNKRIVVGIGLNVNNSWRYAPDDLRAVGTSLTDLTHSEHDLQQVLERLLVALEESLGQLYAGDQRLPASWQTLCMLKGRQVEIEQGQQMVKGLCEGIDADGALVVQVATGRTRVFGGIVRSFR